MDGINLICVAKRHAGAVWRLERTRRGLRLCDDEDQIVLRMTAAEAVLRVHLPSFWGSRSYIMIDPDRGEALCFEPKPKAVGRVRDLIEDCLDQNPAAAASAMRRKARRDFLVGGGLFLLGIIVTVISLASAGSDGKFVVMTGLLAGGLFEIGRGIYWTMKANQQEQRMDDDDDYDEESE